jgi:hypothetical protein
MFHLSFSVLRWTGVWMAASLISAMEGSFEGEEAIATADNCTFTRHTGLPAVVVSEATDVLFRHCTIPASPRNGLPTLLLEVRADAAMSFYRVGVRTTNLSEGT